MAEWSVKPLWKKSVIERQEWFGPNGQRLIIETGWRWGEFTVYTDDDNPPNLEAGVDIFSCGYETELVECSDGCWEEHDMDECDEETREWLEEFLEENSYFDLEEHGWTYGDTEMIIDCDMEITRVDSDVEQVIHTGSSKEEILNQLDEMEKNAVPDEDNSDLLEAPAKWPFTRPHEGPKEEE